MNLIKSFSAYAFFNILNAAIPFLLIPVLTDYLTPNDYGILTNVDVFFRITLPFIILGINAAINTAYFRMERADLPVYISTGVFLSFLSSVLFFVIYIFFSSKIETYIQLPKEWLLIAPFYCFFQGISQIVLGLFQVQKKAFHFGIYQVSLTLMNISLSLFFVIYLNYSWTGRLLGLILTYITFMVIGLLYLHRKKLLVSKFSKGFAKDLLFFGIPLLPHLLAGPIIQFSDRFFISSFAGNNWTGLYNVAFQIGSSISLITVAFNQAWVPFLYEKLGHSTHDQKTKLVKYSYLLMLAFLLMAIVLYILSPLIFKFFVGTQFQASQQFIFAISLGSAIGGMYFMVANYIFYQKKTYILSWVTISNAILSIGLNLILVRKYGAWGAAYTYIISNAFLFISVWFLSNKVYPMPWFSAFSKKNNFK